MTWNLPYEWWETMKCWNGLTPDQQEFLRTEGYLPLGFRHEGWCRRPIVVEIVTIHDEFPGPRFYCRDCAVEYLATLPPPTPVVGGVGDRRR